MCAGTDNVGLFFGEDIFIAFGAVLRHRLFWPALLIPFVAVLLAVALKDVPIAGHTLLGREQTTVVALGVACALALGAACWLTRESLGVAVEQSRRLLDAIDWAALLPLIACNIVLMYFIIFR